MTSRRKLAELDLVLVLIGVAALELMLNRLAVPVLRPTGGAGVPPWHRDLDVFGLFVFYLATALAFIVGIAKVIGLSFRSARFGPLPRAFVLGASVLFYGLAAYGVLGDAPSSLSFHLESCFTLLLLLLGMAMAMRPGHGLVKLGFVVLTIPFLLHYYGTFALRLLIGPEARGSSLPDTMRDVGQWSVAVAAIGVSVCFAPRPLGRSLTRTGPAAIAAFVGTILTIVMVRHEDVGLEMASKGLGLDFGPGAPAPVIGAFVLAAMAIAWTLTSTWTAEDVSRRHLGSGLALVCIGGYAFTWPLTLLTVVAGALVIVDTGTLLPESEVAPPLRSIPISDTALRDYLRALATELCGAAEPASERGVVRGERWLVRVDSQPPAVDITFGQLPDSEPVWTLEARPERLLHGRPRAPTTSAPQARTGDHAFDLRFRVHDSAGLTPRLFDAGLRARAAAVLDGWVAMWPGGALRYHVRPGHGAPVDHPLPLTALRGGETGDPRRLAAVFELLAELSRRAT